MFPAAIPSFLITSKKTDLFSRPILSGGIFFAAFRLPCPILAHGFCA